MPFEKIRILGIKGLGLAAARIASKKAKVSALIPRAVSPMAAKPLEEERWQPICNIKKDLLSVSGMTNGKGRS